MTSAIPRLVFLILWHWRDGREVSPIDQLAAWQTADAATILADLGMIAHTTTSHWHRGDGDPAGWLRFDKAGLVLDLLEDGRAVRTLDQATLLEGVRDLLDADDPPAVPVGPTRRLTDLAAGDRTVGSTPAAPRAAAPGAEDAPTRSCRQRERRVKRPVERASGIETGQLSLFGGGA